MAINMEDGQSVYCRVDWHTRVNAPLYCAARQLVRDFSSTSSILDLGCSDLVASEPLSSDFNVIGLDLCGPALNQARHNLPNSKLAQADVRQIPLLDPHKTIGAILLLDVLEHFSHKEAVGILVSVSEQINEPYVIVSMPIIHWLSVPAWRERALMVREGQRPQTGLFDRTHKLLYSQSQHRLLFGEANFDVVTEGYTTPIGPRLVGIDYPEHSNHVKEAISKERSGIYRKIFNFLPPKLKQTLFAYQGIYVLQHS